MDPLIIDRYLGILAAQDGSDLYLTAGAIPLAKVGSGFVALGERTLGAADLAEIAAPFLEGERGVAFAKRPELDLAHWLPEVGRFRINVFRQRGHIAVVARRVRRDVPTIEDLGLPPVLKKLALERQGLVCVTGATGSGKSTTLAAMIDHRNENMNGHILTIEDPIEFVHEHKASIVSQREVGSDTPTYHDALRSALRQAPDLLLLGEIRDLEGAEAALHFAETGHLVFATLHATNAANTFERLVHLFPSERAIQIYQLLSINMLGVVSQRLVPAADGHGKVAALEILLPTARIRDLVRAGDIDGIRDALREGVREEGLQTFDDSLYALAMASRITEERAIAYADSPTDLRIQLRKMRGESQRDLERIKWMRE